jgi:hypothetical protein
VAASAVIDGQTKRRNLCGQNRATDPAIAPRWRACPEGNESQALPERGIPWRRPWTTTRSGRLRSTRRLNRCGSTPASATQHSMWSARRAISMSRLLNRAYVQKRRVAPSTIFSSASQVTTRSVRSIPGVAARAHARLRTRSPRVGGKVMRPRWDMRNNSQAARTRATSAALPSVGLRSAAAAFRCEP